CATPKDTDNILARSVKKEYALAEVFSTPVTQAHLLGRIHINDLEFVDRLYSCEQHVATASVFGQVQEDLPEIKHGNGSPAAVVAAIMKHHDFLQTFFSSSVDWQGFNFLAAPFVARAGDPELRLFARTIIREFAYRAFLRKRSPCGFPFVGTFPPIWPAWPRPAWNPVRGTRTTPWSLWPEDCFPPYSKPLGRAMLPGMISPHRL
ncbi:MAG TPA: hypothetical protein PLC40_08275, partial [Candidatus Hydrogenedentes bacterium]|nr:hypothetical protein [Candidatus Hydrogenedentota bacterium]